MRTSTTIRALLAIGLVSCGLFSQRAEAVPITGEIDFQGHVTLNTNSLGTATSVIQFRNGQTGVAGGLSVTDATGSFSSISLGSFAAFTTPYSFNPGSPYPNLWQVGGFNFNLLSSTVVTQNAFFIEVHGTGIVTGNGYDPTPGTWFFSVFTDNGATRAYGNFAPAPLPEGGSALLYLGMALTCLKALRRIGDSTNRRGSKL